MRIAICDDQKEWRDIIQSSVVNYAKAHSLEINVLCFSSISDLMESDLASFSILITDVRMDANDINADGLRAALDAYLTTPATAVIIVSGYINFAYLGYYCNVTGFVLKDRFDDQFPHVLEIALESLKGKSGQSRGTRREMQKRAHEMERELDCELQRVRTQAGEHEQEPERKNESRMGNFQGHLWDSITYIETCRDGVIVHTRDAEYVHTKTLTEAAAELEPHGFARIQRSFLVNFAYVERFHNYTVRLKDGTDLSCTRKNYRSLASAYELWKKENESSWK